MPAVRTLRSLKRCSAAARTGRAPATPRWAALAMVAAVAGCSGGLFIGFGESSFDDRPSVSLVASVAAAAPGQAFRLSAAASDDGIVISVQFLRLEPDGAVTALGTDAEAPWERETTMPAGAAAQVSYFARATDNTGRHADSETVAVRVLR